MNEYCFVLLVFPSVTVHRRTAPAHSEGGKNTSVLFSSISKEWRALLRKDAGFWRSASPICQSVWSCRHRLSNRVFSVWNGSETPANSWAFRRREKKNPLYVSQWQTHRQSDRLIEGSWDSSISDLFFWGWTKSRPTFGTLIMNSNWIRGVC